ASRGLPFELEVWPAVGATAWFWATATNPGALLSTSTDPQSLPYLITPTGPSQNVNELDGASSVGRLSVQAIHPGRVRKGLAARPNLIGKIARFKMGFPGQS